MERVVLEQAAAELDLEPFGKEVQGLMPDFEMLFAEWQAERRRTASIEWCFRSCAVKSEIHSRRVKSLTGTAIRPLYTLLGTEGRGVEITRALCSAAKENAMSQVAKHQATMKASRTQIEDLPRPIEELSEKAASLVTGGVDDDDEDEFSGGALAVLLLAIGGAVAAPLI